MVTGATAFLVAALDEADEAALRRIADRLGPHLPRGGNDEDGWLRGRAAAASYLGCSVDRVQEFVSAGKIPHERDGGSLLFKRSELDAWIRSGGAKRRPPRLK